MFRETEVAEVGGVWGEWCGRVFLFQLQDGDSKNCTNGETF